MTRCADDRATDSTRPAQRSPPPSRSMDHRLRWARSFSAAIRSRQCVACARTFDREGGCLLADDVGTGKTYVALAVAREWSRPLVVHPASLRATWEHAARRAGVRCGFTSHEALSREAAVDQSFDGVVVDESHRFRPTSRRHAALAALTAHAPVLMLSATPLQNRARELAAAAGAVPRRDRLPALARRARAPRGALGKLGCAPTAARHSSALASHRCGRRRRAAGDPRASTASARGGRR